MCVPSFPPLRPPFGGADIRPGSPFLGGERRAGATISVFRISEPQQCIRQRSRSNDLLLCVRQTAAIDSVQGAETPFGSAPRTPFPERGTDRRDIRDASSIPRRPLPAQGRRLSAAQRCAPRSPHPHSTAFHRSGRDRPARGCPRAGRGCRAAGRCGIRAARRRARCGTPRGRGSGR